LHIVQLDRSLSTADTSFITYANLLPVNSHNYEFVPRSEYSEKEISFMDREFYQPYCVAEYTP